MDIAVKQQIDKIQEDCEKIKPLVVIRCITYNQEAYIREALEGFVSQQTTFPFVAIVHDDASTDGTAKIVREYAEKYPHIIMPIFEIENQYSKRDGSLGKVVNLASELTGAKYLALCEGDDYWIDPLKLQKQVDFLESNIDYSMCYTSVKRFNQSKNTFEKIIGGKNEEFNDLIIINTIPTLSAVMKQEVYVNYQTTVSPASRNWKMGDFPLWLYCAGVGKVKYLSLVTGVYRVLQNSASHFSNPTYWYEFSKSYRAIQIYFWDLFSKDARLLEKINIGTFKTVLHIRTVNDTSLIKECNEALDRITSFSPIKKAILKTLNNNVVLNRCLKYVYTLRDRKR